MWCFGALDQAKLCITPLGRTFEIYVAEHDEEVILDLIGDVVAWIDGHEPDDDLSPDLRRFLQ